MKLKAFKNKNHPSSDKSASQSSTNPEVMQWVPGLTELELFGWALRSEKSVRLVIFKKGFFIFKVDTVREKDKHQKSINSLRTQKFREPNETKGNIKCGQKCFSKGKSWSPGALKIKTTLSEWFSKWAAGPSPPNLLILYSHTSNSVCPLWLFPS